MKKLLSTLIVLSVVFSASASNLFFKRLDKLYQKDKQQCLTVAKRYIKYLPKQSASYYFATVIYKFKAENARNSRGEYMHLKKAISYALKFEELKDEELQNEVNWLHVKDEITDDAHRLIATLDEANEFAFSERLKSQLIDFTQTFTEENVSMNEDVETNEIAEVYESSNGTKLFFGMPTGLEIVQSSDLSGEKELLGYINEERKKQGMVPLEWEEDLAKASRYHAYDLGTQNYFNHATYDRKNGKLVRIGGTFDRIKKFYSKSFVNGENIAAGNESPRATYMQWFNSPGHYAIMFNPESTKIGIGTFYVEDSPFGHYWSMCTAK